MNEGLVIALAKQSSDSFWRGMILIWSVELIWSSKVSWFPSPSFYLFVVVWERHTRRARNVVLKGESIRSRGPNLKWFYHQTKVKGWFLGARGSGGGSGARGLSDMKAARADVGKHLRCCCFIFIELTLVCDSRMQMDTSFGMIEH